MRTDKSRDFKAEIMAMLQGGGKSKMDIFVALNDRGTVSLSHTEKTLRIMGKTVLEAVRKGGQGCRRGSGRMTTWQIRSVPLDPSSPQTVSTNKIPDLPEGLLFIMGYTKHRPQKIGAVNFPDTRPERPVDLRKLKYGVSGCTLSQ